jgi:hypothetical protein
MKKTIFIILLLSYFCSFGQNDSIEKRIYDLGKEKTKLLKSENIKIDSIKVTVNVYEDRIETESYFDTTYLLIGKSFDKIVTRENCPFKPEDFWRSYVYEFKNGKVVDEEERYYSSARMHGIAGHMDKEVRESYNKTLNSEFLKKFVVELFEKIKNYR